MKSLLKILIFPGLLLFFMSCEDKNNSLPLVEISFPPQEYQISIPDTINIRGKVTDENGVNFLKIQLVNEHLQNPVLLFSTEIDNQTEYIFDINSVVYDNDIPTGNYYIKATAYNTENVSSDFVKVYVNEAPLELEKIVVSTLEASGLLSVKTLDKNYNTEHIMDYEGDFVGSAIYSPGRQFFIALNDPSYTYSLDLSTGLTNWSEQAHQPYPLFTDLLLHENIIYLSTENGEIYGMDVNQNPKFNILTNPDTVPEKIFVFNNFLISDSRKRLGSSHHIMVYYRETGVFIHRKLIQDSVLGFYALYEEQLLCFSGSTHGGTFRYTPSSNIISEQNQFDFRINYIARIDETHFLLATDKKVYLYEPEGHLIYPVISQSGIKQITFEPLQQRIILATDDRIQVLGYPSFEVVVDLEWNSKVKKIDFLYNKNPDF